MKKVCVVTATRAEYGLLKPVLERIQEEEALSLCLLVTGAHLSALHGETVKEIEKDGFPIAGRIPMELSDTSPVALNREMAGLQEKAGEFFQREAPDFLLLLGDRYEMLSVAAAAMMCRIPIGHIHGGETTEGAMDEAIRHAITKMSYLHFTSIPEYRKRVIQLGEEPARVFCVGALGVENILKLPLLSETEIRQQLQIEAHRPYAMVTFHPVTLEREDAQQQLLALMAAMEGEPEYDYVVTFSNADAGGNRFNQMWQAFAQGKAHLHLYASLGVQKYLSALKYASLVMGNSSSGILEAPSFRHPVINIGDRQKGRLQAGCVLNCPPREEAIRQAMEQAKSPEFQKKLETVENPYGTGSTSDKIVEQVLEYLREDKIDLKKPFFDVDFILEEPEGSRPKTKERCS
jgi:GDP/UDP-N,N'-diacetylbacillosamine 2-epimerase (hydrolysing)